MTALKLKVDCVLCIFACTLLAGRANADDWGYKSAEQQPGSRAEELLDGPLPPNSDFSSEMLRKLMRPSFDFAAEWQAETDDVGLASYDASVKFPTFPLFGPPPPFINIGFSYTDVDAPSALGLPTELFETELGFAWMRRINERWMARFMAGASFATDGNNSTSDAWRFRGGVFALYGRNPEWTWTFGAIALGRNDLPVVPAVGIIHQPNPAIRFDLIMPRPRISCLLADNGPRQQWGYVGAALNGTTWGVERADRTDDQLTYGDFRVVIGWESTPTPEPGIPFTRGQKLGAELGYSASSIAPRGVSAMPLANSTLAAEHSVGWCWGHGWHDLESL